MADDTLTPSTPGSFGRDGVDLHGAIQHVERVLGWLKDHLIQSGDTSLRQYDASLAQTGSVRQAPDPDPLAPTGGMTPTRLAQAASRATTQYQRGNPGGSATAPSDDPVADILKGVTVPDQVRSAAWKAYYDTTSLDDFTARVKGVAIPDAVKAQLWNLKSASSKPRITVSPAIEADARLGPHTMTDSEPSWYENLLSALKPLAQPRTVDDIGHILMTPTRSVNPDGTRGALAAVPAVARTMTRATAATGRGLEATGGAIEAAGQSKTANLIGKGGALGEVLRGDFTRAAIALLGPSAITATGRIIKATGKAMQPPVRPFNGLPIEPYMANRSGYVADAPAAEGAMPLAGSVDRYAPNVSGASDVAAEGAAAVKTPAQATYTQLPDGTWGITGRNLVSGDAVHVMKRNGVGEMLQVGSIVDDANGVQTAMLSGSSPAETAIIGSVRLTQAELTRALGLVKQGHSPSDALKAVLSARQ